MIHNISFNHVYRQFNIEVDALSKKALVLQEGSFWVMEYRESTITSISKHFLF